ncbi:hypothetical protein Aab01nite_07630 [Paractinoplanes abujensis]|uniref:Uncharacterized protein n=1 Tax=Paractinoplanes abujensis TaxID=882441 RepID=A0A7W7CN92_9ACTN|nr:hypothetical protein [Actinoplanes abujensis]MBB4691414.1 hypothetical protein [Actinoplanes abujensis]GID17173.1 hypothetical protein Aab01nite_07630 [Actinoplanes abujensis]
MTGDDDVSPAWAAVALAEIDQSRAAVREHSAWVGRALIAYGMASVVFFPVSGLVHGFWSVVVGVCWGVFLVSVLCYAAPRRVMVRGFRALYLRATAAWTALWLAGSAIGHLLFADRVAFWVPAGVVVALPMFAAAARTR